MRYSEIGDQVRLAKADIVVVTLLTALLVATVFLARPHGNGAERLARTLESGPQASAVLKEAKTVSGGSMAVVVGTTQRAEEVGREGDKRTVVTSPVMAVWRDPETGKFAARQLTTAESADATMVARKVR